jgi:asparagine synthase (glutamine-hydrolysing)
MKYGLEVRSPFLDRNLIEFAFKLPTKYKFNSFQTKRILKDIYRPNLGSDIVDRRKKGFGFPLEDLVSKPEALKMLSRNDATLQQLANNTSKKYNLLSLALFQEKA